MNYKMAREVTQRTKDYPLLSAYLRRWRKNEALYFILSFSAIGYYEYYAHYALYFIVGVVEDSLYIEIIKTLDDALALNEKEERLNVFYSINVFPSFDVVPLCERTLSMSTKTRDSFKGIYIGKAERQKLIFSRYNDRYYSTQLFSFESRVMNGVVQAFNEEAPLDLQIATPELNRFLNASFKALRSNSVFV